MSKSRSLSILKDKMNIFLTKNEDAKIRKPLIIEFSGSPKSGKTTIIKQFESFFKEYGFKTYSIIEKASISRITNKQSPDFNMWTTLHTCIDMLEIADLKKYDIIFIDRGIFDSLCWFKWHLDSNKLDFETYKAIEGFISIQRWVKEINLVFAFIQDSKTTISRDTYKLFNETGSILNQSVLDKYIMCIENTYSNHKDKFKHVELINTNQLEYDEIKLQIGEKIIELLERLMNEQIGYFKWDKLNMDTINGSFSIKKLLKCELQFYKRDVIEKGHDYQPIPCAIILNESGDRIFVAKKTKDSLQKNSPELNKYLLWVGGHVREDDMSSSYTNLETFKNTLHREIKEEVGLEIKIKDEESFCIYTPSTPKSKQHIAICFIIRVNEFNSFKQDDEELLYKYGNSKYGKFHDIANFNSSFKADDFEEWSQIIGYKLKLFDNLQLSMSY